MGSEMCIRDRDKMMARRTVSYLCTFFYLFSAFFLFVANTTASAQVYSTEAKHAILIDVASGATLYEHDADTPMPPASMAKIMTLAVVFDALKRGELSLKDGLPMSDQRLEKRRRQFWWFDNVYRSKDRNCFS